MAGRVLILLCLMGTAYCSSANFSETANSSAPGAAVLPFSMEDADNPVPSMSLTIEFSKQTDVTLALLPVLDTDQPYISSNDLRAPTLRGSHTSATSSTSLMPWPSDLRDDGGSGQASSGFFLLVLALLLCLCMRYYCNGDGRGRDRIVINPGPLVASGMPQPVRPAQPSGQSKLFVAFLSEEVERGHTWNSFQNALGGRGYTSAQLSQAWREYKASGGETRM